MIKKYLQEQANAVDKELQKFERQVQKDKAEQLAKLGAEKETRLKELQAKEENILNMDRQMQLAEEKHAAQFEAQKAAILKKQQDDQKRELAAGLSKEEAEKLMKKHRANVAALEGTLAEEQKR